VEVIAKKLIASCVPEVLSLRAMLSAFSARSGGSKQQQMLLVSSSSTHLFEDVILLNPALQSTAEALIVVSSFPWVPLRFFVSFVVL